MFTLLVKYFVAFWSIMTSMQIFAVDRDAARRDHREGGQHFDPKQSMIISRGTEVSSDVNPSRNCDFRKSICFGNRVEDSRNKDIEANRLIDHSNNPNVLGTRFVSFSHISQISAAKQLVESIVMGPGLRTCHLFFDESHYGCNVMNNKILTIDSKDKTLYSDLRPRMEGNILLFDKVDIEQIQLIDHDCGYMSYQYLFLGDFSILLVFDGNLYYCPTKDITNTTQLKIYDNLLYVHDSFYINDRGCCIFEGTTKTLFFILEDKNGQLGDRFIRMYDHGTCLETIIGVLPMQYQVVQQVSGINAERKINCIAQKVIMQVSENIFHHLLSSSNNDFFVKALYDADTIRKFNDLFRSNNEKYLYTNEFELITKFVFSQEQGYYLLPELSNVKISTESFEKLSIFIKHNHLQHVFLTHSEQILIIQYNSDTQKSEKLILQILQN